MFFSQSEILLKGGVKRHSHHKLYQPQTTTNSRQSFTAIQKYIYTPCSNNFFIFYFLIINLKNMACNYKLKVIKLDKI